ncbi:MAG: 3-methylornithyl-N6-L-lysine dehydrogenase PylD [Desulfobacterium sp.]|nr:3-methylornithyl-N6-L-lysine dehydrogenase PylD [Desulfobacterium sp.]
MTRLSTGDICGISSSLETYDLDLVAKTGRTLLGVACHAGGVNEETITPLIKPFSIHVVPITAGQGVISNFSETVAAILEFTGFSVQVSEKPDVSGVAQAFERGADAVMMSDDHRFVGINLKTRCVVDNSEATGRVFAAALDLMARGINEREALVMGCGPVGQAAARTLLSFNARVSLYDSNLATARLLKDKLGKGRAVRVETEIKAALLNHEYILEATPSADTIPDELLGNSRVVAAPGVPLGVSKTGCKILNDRLIHDKLELGVAAMAISLVPGDGKTGGYFE